MNAVAIKCRKCNRTTLDPSGLCFYHKNSTNTAKATRSVPALKSSSSNGEDFPKSQGWLAHETGISVADYAQGVSMLDLPEDEQFVHWMKARVSIRAIESVYARKGVDGAKDYANSCDDTSLALIWERLNGSTMSEFTSDGLREGFVSVVRDQVEQRVENGTFAPLPIDGYIQAFGASDEPSSASSFF